MSKDKDEIFSAVALRYPDWADAPYISAKAKGSVARRLVEIADKNDVPIVQNAEMANVLSLQRLGSFIPESTYSAIAAIFAFVIKLDEANS
ncbi:MAG: EscU/YscU/HrcU family type III secretion system export apparatus switch protein [Treponema sp.]|uniref:EscU/YscU/HrcU family type III secretion system export apparatus switch protein n=1 Tax=Treponema sp. TaxID=166 RepID=UPI001B751C7A|nr:EscU/YscU/HrcU family type III secretion system export apparatus switch protein [Treponema sp.]MBP3773587.1 EscU/YscU/HrcU family type III secretion system export apparatus switch protein [Treponema sp.]MBQ9282092.1 EscU/YscU/HrcU family type III secretion system export apparatus switch protein [Treponema sp.]